MNISKFNVSLVFGGGYYAERRQAVVYALPPRPQEGGQRRKVARPLTDKEVAYGYL